MTGQPLKVTSRTGGGLTRWASYEDALERAVRDYWRNRPSGRRVADLPPPSTSQEASEG